jgi:hypothetical protein
MGCWVRALRSAFDTHSSWPPTTCPAQSSAGTLAIPDQIKKQLLVKINFWHLLQTHLSQSIRMMCFAEQSNVWAGDSSKSQTNNAPLDGSSSQMKLLQKMRVLQYFEK